MPNLINQHLWFPYTQMQKLDKVYEVKSAQGAHLKLSDERELLDGISSWWSVVYGYNHPKITSALIEQLQQVSHVMLGGLSNEPARKFADLLAKITPEGLNHVFFSDSGSVGVEVALKIAIQYFSNQKQFDKKRILSLEGSYHGDTFKAMEVGGDSDFQQAFSHIFSDKLHLPKPKHAFDADNDSIQKDIDLLEQMLKAKNHEIAAFIVEPLVQCVGNFNIYSPKYLQAARKLCDEYNVLLIFDEVATGFGRTGKLFAASHAGISPDIIILGKALTAGYLGHAATVVSDKVYEAFLDETYEKAFMHGPTYMGNALACAVGLKAYEIFEQENYLEKISKIEVGFREKLLGFQHKKVKEIRVLGAIAVIEVWDESDLLGFQEFGIERGVWLRPFGPNLYTMPAYILEQAEINKITETMLAWFK